uniref:Protein-tyrosine phosphatase n=1 Tax=Parastrongyloides trichosuri TaxID=131310 RepID=A0A0N4Z2I1_PARTI
MRRKCMTEGGRLQNNNGGSNDPQYIDRNMENLQEPSFYQKKDIKHISKSSYATDAPSLSPTVNTPTQRENYENTARQIDNDKEPKNKSMYLVSNFDEKPLERHSKPSITYSSSRSTASKPSQLRGTKKSTLTPDGKAKTMEGNAAKEGKGILGGLYARSLKLFKPISNKCAELGLASAALFDKNVNVDVCPKIRDIVGYEVNEAIFDRNLRDFINPEIKISPKKHETDFVVTRRHVIKMDPFYRIAFNSNISKCRYKDVYCLDRTRVHLNKSKSGKTNDFIHANYVSIRDYIDGYKMICAQGPLPGTVVDFWRMIVQEKCQNIVMLTQVYESIGKSQVKKCEQYWPLRIGESVVYGTVKITNTKVVKLCYGIQITELEVVDNNSTRLNVSHILMSNWPDKGAPKVDFTMFIILQQLVRSSPSVIHCSAGIGRTGTLAVIDMLLARLSIDCPPISLAAMVQNLRLYRHGAVQTESQFIYILRVMILLAVSRGVVAEKDVAAWCHEYDIVTGVTHK